MQLAVPLCLGTVLWDQALHATLGAHERGEPVWWVHWIRDSAIALPVVVLAVWAALALVARLRHRVRADHEPVLVVVATAVAASYVLAVGSPVHTWLFAAHQGIAEPPLVLHIARDAVLTLPATLAIAAVAMRSTLRAAGEQLGPNAAARDLGAGDAALVLTRRRVVQIGIASGAGLLLPFEWVRAASGDIPHSPLVTPFQTVLAVPAAPTPTRVAGVDTYSITAAVAQSQIFPTGASTRVWAYEGASPGPVILAEGGTPVDVTFHNALAGEIEPDGEPVRLTTHFHGGHQAPTDDGWATDIAEVPDAEIPIGGSRTYHFPNLNDIGRGIAEPGKPLWFHDHLMDVTGFNVYQGLAGGYLIHNAAEDAFDLPGTGADAMARNGYGVVDIPLFLQDRLFNADHSLNYPHEDKGVLGDTFLVNGRIQPRFDDVPRRKLRFRIYNGSNRRWYNLALSTGQPFIQVGNEAGLLPAPVARQNVLLAPAERADVVVDFSRAPNTVDLLTVPAGIDEADVRAPLLRFNVAAATAIDHSRVPGTLRVVPPLGAPAVRRSFRFERGGGEWVVNGRRFDPDRAAFTVKRDAIEEWTLANSSGGWVHPIHIHDVPFQVIAHGGRAPAPWERNEKDTVALGHGDSATVRLKFIDFTGPYVFHCHNMEHEDMRMMVRFDVVP
jgi:spore coat protein A, manganese oxidase